MDGYVNAEKVAVAYGLHKNLKAAGLGHIEHYLLITLAKRMGRKTDLDKGELLNGCRPSHEFLEETDVILERKAIGKYIGHLEDAGFIRVTKDRHRAPEGELTKEGKRRVARGLPLDDGSDENNYVKKPMGRPRKDGKIQSQWEHCCYFTTPIWDTIKFEGSTKERKETDAPVVDEARMAADSKVLDEIVDTQAGIVPQAVATENEPAIEEKHLDEVFRVLKFYFGRHKTMQHDDAERKTIHIRRDLARRALELGGIDRAGDFLSWLIKNHPAIVKKIMALDFLGGSIGLPKYIAALWPKFMASGHSKSSDIELDADQRSVKSAPKQGDFMLPVWDSENGCWRERADDERESAEHPDDCDDFDELEMSDSSQFRRLQTRHVI